MKRIIGIIILISLVCSCASDKELCGRVYTSKGLFTLDEKNDKVVYEAVPGNVIWGIILIETIVAPVYFFGFSMYEAKGLKEGYDCNSKVERVP